MEFLQAVGAWFLENPMIAILLSMCIGHLIGKINFGKFALGSTVGTLFVAMLIGQAGVFEISTVTKMLFLSLCVFVIGYESGPAFVNGFKGAGLKVILCSLFFAGIGTALAVGLCKIFQLDPGTSAGIFGGGLTQTAVIATAGDAIASLGYDEATTKMLQGNVSIAYALTYFFGTAGLVILVQRVEPLLMRIDLKEAAMKKVAAIDFKEEGTQGDGTILEKQKETDIPFVCIGIVLGLIVGAFSVTVGYIPLSLGSICGILVIGMILGCIHEKNPKIGYIPSTVRWFLMIYGLNLFMACTGLGCGKDFMAALQTMGAKIFLIGIAVTMGTHLLTMVFGYYVLKMDAVDVLGTQVGTGTSVPGLNALIDRSGSSVFALSYAPAYAIGNILLTVMGSVIVFMLA